MAPSLREVQLNARARGPRSYKRKSFLKTAGVVGAVAFSRIGDTDTGIFDDAVVLKRFGEAPTDLTIWS